jgi:hypothetical protein
MDDFDEFLCGRALRGVLIVALIDHVLSNVVLDDFRDEAVQGAAAGGCLLQNRGAFVVRLNRFFDCSNLAAQPFDAI